MSGRLSLESRPFQGGSAPIGTSKCPVQNWEDSSSPSDVPLIDPELFKGKNRLEQPCLPMCFAKPSQSEGRSPSQETVLFAGLRTTCALDVRTSDRAVDTAWGSILASPTVDCTDGSAFVGGQGVGNKGRSRYSFN